MKIDVKSKKGLSTVLSVIVDKKNIQSKKMIPVRFVPLLEGKQFS